MWLLPSAAFALDPVSAAQPTASHIVDGQGRTDGLVVVPGADGRRLPLDRYDGRPVPVRRRVLRAVSAARRRTARAVGIRASRRSRRRSLGRLHAGPRELHQPRRPGRNYSEQEGLPVSKVRSFARTADGAVWAAVIGGLARFDGTRWQKVRMDWNYPCGSAWRLFVDRQGTLWVAAASPNGIYFLPKGTRTFQDTGLRRRRGDGPRVKPRMAGCS